MRVKNMLSDAGNRIANQFIIMDDENKIVYFQSYNIIIVKRDDKTGQITLDTEKWDYSATTGKYRNLFLNETIAETRKKIKTGLYKLENLNK